MPVRKNPHTNEYYYHVYCRMLNPLRYFDDNDSCQHFLDLLWYYRRKTFASISHYKRQPEKTKHIHDIQRSRQPPRITLIAYCIMPNHYHLLMKQVTDNGIAQYMQQINSSLSHFINTKYKRKGPIFEGPYNSKLIETDEQLLHVCRYIHLNPYTSHIVKTKDQLLEYPHSSLSSYNQDPGSIQTARSRILINTKQILSHFNSHEEHLKFTLDQANYQRTLKSIQKYTFEDLT